VHRACGVCCRAQGADVKIKHFGYPYAAFGSLFDAISEGLLDVRAGLQRT
jgi:hypothetical protein